MYQSKYKLRTTRKDVSRYEAINVGYSNMQGRALPSYNYMLTMVITYLSWENFQTDSQVLYSLYVEHVGTQGIGSSTINNQQT